MKNKFYYLIFFFCLVLFKGQVNVSFNKTIISDESFGVVGPKISVLQDVDNDGLKDILTTGSTSIVYFKNLGNQLFSKPKTLLSLNSYIEASQLIDIDGDGIKDLVYINGLDYGNFYWKKGLNNLPQFGEPILLDDNVFQFVFSDIDKDGDLDLFTLRYPTMQNIKIGWKENTGNGNFSIFHQIYTANRYPDQIALADLNNDAALDIVHYEEQYDVFAVKMKTGSDFGETQQIDNTAYQSLIRFYVDDVNGDGHNDIIYLFDTGHTKSVSWYKNDGQGNFSKRLILSNITNFSTGGNTDVFDFQYKDIDKDGLKDLIFSDSRQAKIWWKKI